MNTTRSRVFLFCLIAACFAFSTPNCFGISVRHDRAITDYNNLGGQFPATGYIYNFATAGQHCTATLVSPTQILTAAHCIDDNFDGTADWTPANLQFGLQANIVVGVSNIASFAVNPNWSAMGGSAQYDMALLTLNAPINTVTPAQISFADPTGLMGFAVGYGTQGDGDGFPDDPYPGANNKLGAENIIDFVGTDIRFDFDSPALDTSTLGSTMPLNLEGATGPGDSGGPLYALFGAQTYIVGDLNGGFNPTGTMNPSEYGDVSIYASMRDPFNQTWLAGQGIFPVPEPGACGIFAVVVVGLVSRRRRN